MTPTAGGPFTSPPLPTDPQAWAAVTTLGGRWRRVEVLGEVGSTNAVTVERASAGEEPGLVVVAEFQSAGRGRLDRSWSAPAGTSLTFSALVQPTVSRSAWGWLPLLAGLAVAEAIAEQTDLTPSLKWPNDVLIDERKIAGLLVEVVPTGGAVVGIGLNTHLDAPDLPVPTATSLLLEGVGADAADRHTLLSALLTRLAVRLDDLDAGPSNEAMADYRLRCATIGRHVDITVPGGQHVRGTVADVADDASLVIDVDGHGVRHIAAGDVVHLR